MILYFLSFFGIAVACGILQTSILHVFAFSSFFPIPDLAFIVLVYVAFTQGEMLGQVLGFTSGIVLDFLSLAPFGFNAFVRTVMGHAIGRFKGVILLDSIFLPMSIVSLSLVVKAIVSIVLAMIIGQTSVTQRIFSTDFVLDFFLTVLLAPAMFLPLKGLSRLLMDRKAYR